MESTDQKGRERQPADRALQSQSGDVEIPAKEWVSFLDSFSRQHEGWLVSISAASEGQEAMKASNDRLEGITTDRFDERYEIRISVIRDQRDHVIHQVTNASRLTFKRDMTGAHEGLDITSADGSVTRLRFRAAAHPESLDGILTDTRRAGANQAPSRTSGQGED